MKQYVKPVVVELEENSEGIYMASGAKEKCQRGDRRTANPGSDFCQRCSATGGHPELPGKYYEHDYKGCPENMPESRGPVGD